MTDSVWENDLLDREWDGEFLYRLSIGRNDENVRTNRGSFVLNIDAPWGQGKSFFLNAIYKQVLGKGHPAIFINAWQYDFVDDPFSIVVAALDRYFKSIQNKKEITKTEKFQNGLRIVRSEFLNITLTLGKAVLKKAINKVAENGVEEMTSLFADTASTDSKSSEKGFAEEMAETVNDQIDLFTDAAIDKFAQTKIDMINETKDSLDNFQGGLKLIIEAISESASHTLPMFIFIDELDRCRPTYAISMLERIKHLFDIPNVVFLIATDTTSLSHSVKAVYGSEFKSREYLGRFFNRTYKLPEASNEKIIREIIVDRGTDIHKWSLPIPKEDLVEKVIFLNHTAEQFGMNIRPIKQALDILLDITSAWEADYRIELTYLFTLICHFVSTGKLDDVEIRDRIQSINPTWKYHHHGDWMRYADVFNGIGAMSHKTIRDAVHESQNEMRASGDNRLPTYFYGAVRGEANVHNDKAAVTKTSFSQYKDMILHSRRLAG